ncbi:hypothetical protein AVEN_66154-1 [Araneus ventricosus]|uniref:Uncharacterized protein n=1 Tax=Araneus ventricosus TaxID=182803 RepID=A0A4Y2MGD8_ARAVE|nr:hypothetical protein AVEN_66154-1 [Araneus ventricosus]
MVPAPLRTKAEEYFSSLETQFNRLFSAIEVRQANNTIFHDKSTQDALQSLNSEAGSKLIKPSPFTNRSLSACHHLCSVTKADLLLSSSTQQNKQQKKK